MRLAPEEIRTAILHPDRAARQVAVRYFSESFSRDTSIMPMVIRAIETYGRFDSAFQYIHDVVDLAQTPKTIDWVIAKLGRPIEPEKELDTRYSFHLSRLLRGADPDLLRPRWSDIEAATSFANDCRSELARRLEVFTWHTERCWRELEEFCETNKMKHYTSEVDLKFAGYLIERLARDPKRCEDRVQAVLNEDFDDLTDSPMSWMEPLLVRLAGELRLESAVPAIVRRIHIDTDWLCEECNIALVKIGTDLAVNALCDDFLDSEWHFQNYASGPLEHIHSDLAVERILGLLDNELDAEIEVSLSNALLGQFTPSAIDIVRDTIHSFHLDGEIRYLRAHLVAVATIMDVPFPEYNRWKAAAEHEEAVFEEHSREIFRRFDGNPERLLHDLPSTQVPKLEFGDEYEDDSYELPAVDHLPAFQPLRNTAARIGRNDPCPCGSGKKFKKCCLNKPIVN